jgi:hypothetical protein
MQAHDLLRGVFQVGLVYYVVSLEDRARLMPGYLHSNCFRDTGPHHVPNPCPSEVMEKLCFDLCILEGFLAYAPKVLDLLSSSRIDIKACRIFLIPNCLLP